MRSEKGVEFAGTALLTHPNPSFPAPPPISIHELKTFLINPLCDGFVRVLPRFQGNENKAQTRGKSKQEITGATRSFFLPFFSRMQLLSVTTSLI